MKIATIGIDLAKKCFKFMASMFMEIPCFRIWTTLFFKSKPCTYSSSNTEVTCSACFDFRKNIRYCFGLPLVACWTRWRLLRSAKVSVDFNGY